MGLTSREEETQWVAMFNTIHQRQAYGLNLSEGGVRFSYLFKLNT